MLHTATCFFVMLCIARGELLQSPEDTEAAVRDVVILKCRTDASANHVEWRFKEAHGPTETTQFEIIYKRKTIMDKFRERFSVVCNTTTGQCDLIIRNVQPSDAGRYTCSDLGNANHAELIVFDKYPSNEFCTATSASNGNQNDCGLELLTLSCDLNYRANQSFRPTLEWLEGNSTILSAVVKNYSDGSVKSSIQLQKRQLETAKFTCRVRYSGSMTTSRFTWSPNMNITPMEKTSIPSYGRCDLRTIECSDEKSPHDCQHTWKDENGTEVSSSSSMKMAGKPNGNYTCFATCKAHQSSCSQNFVAKQLIYRCDDSNSQSTSTISPPETFAPPEPLISPGITSPEIYIPVAALVILIAISLLVVLIVRSKRKRDSYNQNDAEMGQSCNSMEMTDLNGMKLQETDVMLTRNTLPTLGL